MRRFEFINPASLHGALAAKSQSGSLGRFIAGATDVMVDLRSESVSLPPLHLINILHLPELKQITAIPDEADEASSEDIRPLIRIGANVTHTEIEQSADLKRYAPLLSTASAEIGSPQIRNRATIGGNICNASPCADTMPALMALNAQLVLRSMGGERAINLSELLVAPYKTTLAADELVTHIQFKALGEQTSSAFVKLGRRQALSVSRMSVAVIFDLDDNGHLADVRVTAGSVAPIVQRFVVVEEMLTGQVPNENLFIEAGRILAAEMINISGRRWSTPYKEPVAAALLARALRSAMANEAMA